MASVLAPIAQSTAPTSLTQSVRWLPASQRPPSQRRPAATGPVTWMTPGLCSPALCPHTPLWQSHPFSHHQMHIHTHQTHPPNSRLGCPVPCPGRSAVQQTHVPSTLPLLPPPPPPQPTAVPLAGCSEGKTRPASSHPFPSFPAHPTLRKPYWPCLQMRHPTVSHNHVHVTSNHLFPELLQ